MTGLQKTCELIEKTLGKSAAFRKVEQNLYVVKQGSSYVTISVISGSRGDEGDSEKPLVRIYAQVVSGVNPEPALLKQLLTLNAKMRFGAFAFLPEGNLILFVHTMLGGGHMDDKELVATVTDVALIADAYDDRIVARYGGRRMQDVIEDSALKHILGEDSGDDDAWEATKNS